MVQFLLTLYEVRNLSRSMWKIDLSLFLNKNTKEKVSKSYKKTWVLPVLHRTSSQHTSFTLTFSLYHLQHSTIESHPLNLILILTHFLSATLTLSALLSPSTHAPHPLIPSPLLSPPHPSFSLSLTLHILPSLSLSPLSHPHPLLLLLSLGSLFRFLFHHHPLFLSPSSSPSP